MPVQCTNSPSPAGAEVARFQLFNSDTQGGSATDLDLEVFDGPNGTGASVGSSGGATSDEIVTLKTPAARLVLGLRDRLRDAGRRRGVHVVELDRRPGRSACRR